MYDASRWKTWTHASHACLKYILEQTSWNRLHVHGNLTVHVGTIGGATNSPSTSSTSTTSTTSTYPNHLFSNLDGSSNNTDGGGGGGGGGGKQRRRQIVYKATCMVRAAPETVAQFIADPHTRGMWDAQFPIANVVDRGGRSNKKTSMDQTVRQDDAPVVLHLQSTQAWTVLNNGVMNDDDDDEGDSSCNCGSSLGRCCGCRCSGKNGPLNTMLAFAAGATAASVWLPTALQSTLVGAGTTAVAATLPTAAATLPVTAAAVLGAAIVAAVRTANPFGRCSQHTQRMLCTTHGSSSSMPRDLCVVQCTRHLTSGGVIIAEHSCSSLRCPNNSNYIRAEQRGSGFHIESVSMNGWPAARVTMVSNYNHNGDSNSESNERSTAKRCMERLRALQSLCAAVNTTVESYSEKVTGFRSRSKKEVTTKRNGTTSGGGRSRGGSGGSGGSGGNKSSSDRRSSSPTSGREGSPLHVNGGGGGGGGSPGVGGGSPGGGGGGGGSPRGSPGGSDTTLGISSNAGTVLDGSAVDSSNEGKISRKRSDSNLSVVSDEGDNKRRDETKNNSNNINHSSSSTSANHHHIATHREDDGTSNNNDYVTIVARERIVTQTDERDSYLQPHGNTMVPSTLRYHRAWDRQQGRSAWMLLPRNNKIQPVAVQDHPWSNVLKQNRIERKWQLSSQYDPAYPTYLAQRKANLLNGGTNDGTGNSSLSWESDAWMKGLIRLPTGGLKGRIASHHAPNVGKRRQVTDMISDFVSTKGDIDVSMAIAVLPPEPITRLQRVSQGKVVGGLLWVFVMFFCPMDKTTEPLYLFFLFSHRICIRT